METSAKTAMNVNEIFLAIGKFYLHYVWPQVQFDPNTNSEPITGPDFCNKVGKAFDDIASTY